MTDIIMENGKINIPNEFEISLKKRNLKIRTPYMVEIQKLCKDNFRITTTSYFRQKGKDKPYIPEGFLELDGVLFKVRERK